MHQQYIDDEALAELLLQQEINKKKPVPEKTGFCLNCEEPTSGAFCSKECREDYEKMEHLKKVRGY